MALRRFRPELDEQPAVSRLGVEVGGAAVLVEVRLAQLRAQHVVRRQPRRAAAPCAELAARSCRSRCRKAPPQSPALRALADLVVEEDVRSGSQPRGIVAENRQVLLPQPLLPAAVVGLHECQRLRRCSTAAADAIEPIVGAAAGEAPRRPPCVAQRLPPRRWRPAGAGGRRPPRRPPARQPQHHSGGGYQRCNGTSRRAAEPEGGAPT